MKEPFKARSFQEACNQSVFNDSDESKCNVKVEEPQSISSDLQELEKIMFEVLNKSVRVNEVLYNMQVDIPSQNQDSCSIQTQIKMLKSMAYGINNALNIALKEL